MSAAKLWLVRVVTALLGVGYVVSGLALLLIPAWFYANVGPFPPFNRHYSGDLGAFLLPFGVGLLWATGQPGRHLGLLAVAASGGILHALNHLFDFTLDPTVGGGAPSVLSLGVAAALGLAAVVLVARCAERGRRGGSTLVP